MIYRPFFRLQVLDPIFKKYTNKESRFYSIDGINIHYRDEGKGFPVVLLHGAFSSLHTFDAWVNELKSEYRIIRYTLPGFGLTGPTIDNDYGIDRQIGYLMDLLDHLDIRVCHICGSSLGGWLAWESVLKHPGRFEKLILISPAGFLDNNSIPSPFRMARTPFLKHIVRYSVKRPVLTYFLREVYGDPEKITRELVDRYYELFTRNGNVEAFFRLVNSKYKDNSLHLKQIKHPTLILWGEEDNWLPLHHGYRFTTAIPNSRLFTYAGVGHLPMEEIPFRTSRDLRKFLKASRKNVQKIPA